jgi:hypothetical protein
VLFYVCLMAIGLEAAYLSALAWSYAALGRRLASRRPVPPLLVLGVIGITVRTLVAVVSRSSFVYFFQPVLATVAMGFVFLISIPIGRPLIGRLAGEFWPITADEAARPGILRLFRNLTLLWAAVNFASAALTLSLLVSLPLAAFLPVKQLAGFGLSGMAIFVTITLSLRAAHREGLVASPARHPRPPLEGNERPAPQPAFL